MINCCCVPKRTLLRRVWWYRHAVPYRRLELLATGEDEQDEIGSDYVGVIAERGSEEGVAGALAETIVRGRLGPFDHVALSALDGDLPMNAALAESRGEWVCRCDADDLYPPGRLARQAVWLAEHPAFGAACGSFSTSRSESTVWSCGHQFTMRLPR